jgi:tRNA (mo5U34)-methyltransferase
MAEKGWIFDSPEAVEFAKVRQEVIKDVVRAVRERLDLSSALDVGCGAGAFSKFLADLEFRVVGLDGREENTREASRRHAGIEFQSGDVEELSAKQLGTFDFVLCVGLLYHLENPFRAIRNLFSVTKKVLFLESMVVPGDVPSLHLLDEPQLENQGLSYVAMLGTESSIVKFLYRAGFPFVYGFRALPDYVVFQDTPRRKRERTMLVASKEELVVGGLELLREPACTFDFWVPPDRRPWWSPGRMLGFIRWMVSVLRAPGKTV